MSPPDPTLVLVREHIVDVFFGTVFLFIGTIACLIAAFRHRRESVLLLWFGLFIGLYGARILAQVAGILHLFPQAQWPDFVDIVVTYVLVIPSFLFWADRTRSHVRKAFQILAVIGSGIAVIGLAWYAISGSPYTFMRWTFGLAIGTMLLLGPLPLIPSFRKYFIIQSLVLRVVMPLIAVLVMVVDLLLFFGHPPSRYIEPIGFAIWVFALGYEAATYTFDTEKRLLSIESELETARHIQSSILPTDVPVISGIRIAASYNPMSAVAGDYYQFLPTDDRHLGILIADVTGHGIGAALIASMIKVAMQSVVAVASQPERVLYLLNNILTPELNGRLTSAAYLWIDLDHFTASYAAAGHPALLLWKSDSDEFLRIESNGLLFGVSPDVSYPIAALSFRVGDRFLLYTDGLTEPENANHEAFGDHELETVLRRNRLSSVSKLSDALLSALKNWQTPVSDQQDDITVIVLEFAQSDSRPHPAQTPSTAVDAFVLEDQLSQT